VIRLKFQFSVELTVRMRVSELLQFIFVDSDQYVKWSANIPIILSAVLVSVSPTLMNRWWAFLGFLFGHVVWTSSAIYSGDVALLALNGSFILLDLYAIIIRTTFNKYRRTENE